MSLSRLTELPRELAWYLKQHLPLSPTPRLPHCCAQQPALVAEFSGAQTQRYNELCECHDLSSWCGVLNAEQWRENLYVLDVLDKTLGDIGGMKRGLDIGCRNFSYLPAMHSFQPLAWDGVELDAHARYWNGVTRAAYGATLASRYPGCRYHAGSLLQLTSGYDLILWMLPFITLKPLRAYRLPSRFFEPVALLNKAIDLLSPGGTLLIINQGEEEFEIQLRMCQELACHYRPLGEVESLFSPFKNRRYGITVTK